MTESFKFNVIGSTEDPNGEICYSCVAKNVFKVSELRIKVIAIDRFGNITEFDSGNPEKLNSEILLRFKNNIYNKISDGNRLGNESTKLFVTSNITEKPIIEMLEVIANCNSLSKNGSINGLPDSFIRNYSKLHLNNEIIPLVIETVDEHRGKNIILRYDGHYSSLPVVLGVRYLYDTLGNKHQTPEGEINTEISSKFPEIQSLNPFGLDYQNNSNACGIWSANILNQVNEFKITGRRSEIVQTYNKDGKSYQMLNPEILLKATAQVSKDLTPKGRRKPELVIPPIMDKETQDEWFKNNNYTKLKVGNTTFAIDTKYREDSCIDIQAIALSIPGEELKKYQSINNSFIEEQNNIRTELDKLNPNQEDLMPDEKTRIESRKRAVKAYETLKDATLTPTRGQVQTNEQQTLAPQVKKSQSSPELSHKLAPISNTPERRDEIAQQQQTNQNIQVRPRRTKSTI